jgi:hypothetical protein
VLGWICEKACAVHQALLSAAVWAAALVQCLVAIKGHCGSLRCLLMGGLRKACYGASRQAYIMWQQQQQQQQEQGIASSGMFS